MRTTFLGTSSGVPTNARNVSSITLTLTNGNIYMFDCGEGTQHQLQKSILKSSKITTIFITHMHGDHIFGLPGLLSSFSMKNSDVRSEMHVYGPFGLGQYLRSCLRLSDARLSYRLTIHEIIPPENSLQVSEKPDLLESEEAASYIYFDQSNRCYHVAKKDGVTIKAASIKHRVFTLGYVIEEDTLPGKLDVAQALKLGVPRGPLLGKLKSGQDITLENGRTIRSADVIGPEQKGFKVVILGDTWDPSPISEIAKNCDLITHESTLSDEQKERALEYGHSCPSMAAQFAVDIGAKNLILTHFSARFAEEELNKENVESLDLLREQALKIYTSAKGNLFLANDFRTFTLHRDSTISQEQHNPVLQDNT
jgi:ribonuclease Z